MPEEQNNNLNQSANPQFRIPPNMRLVRVRYPQLLLDLFLWPTPAFQILAFASWWGKGILVTLLLIICSAGLKTAFELPELAVNNNRVAQFLGEQLGTVSLVTNASATAKQPQQATKNSKIGLQIQWEKQFALPKTSHLKGLRIDFLDSIADLSPNALGGNEYADHGLILAHDDFAIWNRQSFAENQIFVQSIASNKTLIQNIEKLIDQENIPSQYTPEKLKVATQIISFAMAPALFIVHTIDRLKTICFCVFFFTIFQIIFRQTNRKILGSVVTMAIHSCIPPLVLATLFDAPGVLFISFDNAFWIAMIIYVIFIAFHKRKLVTN